MTRLPATSEQPCPRCKELLHWEKDPEAHFNTRTGSVSYVEMWRFCIGCGYEEIGIVNVDKQPIWTSKDEVQG